MKMRQWAGVSEPNFGGLGEPTQDHPAVHPTG